MIPLPPIALAALPEGWIEDRRAIVVRDGHAVRAGERGGDLSGEPFTLEVKSLRTNEWLRLTLPGGGTTFASAADRDAVLRQLQEG